MASSLVQFALNSADRTNQRAFCAGPLRSGRLELLDRIALRIAEMTFVRRRKGKAITKKVQ
jgi:hypothetical protein